MCDVYCVAGFLIYVARFEHCGTGFNFYFSDPFLSIDCFLSAAGSLRYVSPLESHTCTHHHFHASLKSSMFQWKQRDNNKITRRNLHEILTRFSFLF